MSGPPIHSSHRCGTSAPRCVSRQLRAPRATADRILLASIVARLVNLGYETKDFKPWGDVEKLVKNPKPLSDAGASLHRR